MVVDRLAERHFSAQNEASTGLQDLDLLRLDPFLRTLLFTDGTVSRALETQTLSPVVVDTVEQVRTPAPALLARYLQAAEEEECIRRRVVMTIEETNPSVWAESYVLPERLPAEFLQVLNDSAQGIGGSFQQLKLETWRELLWFGLGPPPAWSPGSTSVEQALMRSYRVIFQGLPALLISEAFALQESAGGYRLLGSGRSIPSLAPSRERAIADD
jgi:chorismate-pyruvate lyase